MNWKQKATGEREGVSDTWNNSCNKYYMIYYYCTFVSELFPHEVVKPTHIVYITDNWPLKSNIIFTFHNFNYMDLNYTDKDQWKLIAVINTCQY